MTKFEVSSYKFLEIVVHSRGGEAAISMKKVNELSFNQHINKMLSEGYLMHFREITPRIEKEDYEKDWIKVRFFADIGKKGYDLLKLMDSIDKL